MLITVHRDLSVAPGHDDRCADHAMTVAVYLALLDEDFTVDGPDELTAAIRTLAGRYTNAVM